MGRRGLYLSWLVFSGLLGGANAIAQVDPQTRTLGNIALVNGQWFNGTDFERKTFYSIDGRFSLTKPKRVDRTLDLNNLWIVPPFAEGHNHDIGQGTEAMQRAAVEKYLKAGVFYVLIAGNIPLTNEEKQRLKLNSPASVDAKFANGQLISHDGVTVSFAKSFLIPRGYAPGHTEESLRDLRYFEVDTDSELETKWPLILSFQPDFIKVILNYSDQHEHWKNDPAYHNQRGLDPKLVAAVVTKAKAVKLPTLAHTLNAHDFHIAVTSGVDIVVHFPVLLLRESKDKQEVCIPIDARDAQLAAQKNIAVVTTTALMFRAPPPPERKSVLDNCEQLQKEGLRLLHEAGVVIAIGSDVPSDSSVEEFNYLRSLNVFDNITLLKMWVENTPKMIFPNRKLGKLAEGYEASFLALEGNPLEDLDNVCKITMRFKQGKLLENNW